MPTKIFPPVKKIPRKGGPGITKSDLLVINKIDLAPLVGASLEIMESDTKRMRGDKPFVFSNLKNRTGVNEVVGFLVGGRNVGEMKYYSINNAYTKRDLHTERTTT